MSLFKLRPFSDMILFGSPYRHMIFFLDELGHYCLRHAGIRRRLYPLGKVVDDYKDKMMVVWGLWGYRPNHIHTPHWERSWRYHYVQGRGWDMYLIYVDLTLMTFSDIVDAIALQCHPIIPSSHYLSCHYVPISMCTTNTFVNLVHDFLSLAGVNAP